MVLLIVVEPGAEVVAAPITVNECVARVQRKIRALRLRRSIIPGQAISELDIVEEDVVTNFINLIVAGGSIQEVDIDMVAECVDLYIETHKKFEAAGKKGIIDKINEYYGIEASDAVLFVVFEYVGSSSDRSVKGFVRYCEDVVYSRIPSAPPAEDDFVSAPIPSAPPLEVSLLLSTVRSLVASGKGNKVKISIHT